MDCWIPASNAGRNDSTLPFRRCARARSVEAFLFVILPIAEVMRARWKVFIGDSLRENYKDDENDSKDSFVANAVFKYFRLGQPLSYHSQ